MDVREFDIFKFTMFPTTDQRVQACQGHANLSENSWILIQSMQLGRMKNGRSSAAFILVTVVFSRYAMKICQSVKEKVTKLGIFVSDQSPFKLTWFCAPTPTYL